MTIPIPGPTRPIPSPDQALLESLSERVLWLSTWMVHYANSLRAAKDGLKVGGHQASSASMVRLMTALYFHVLRRGDLVSVKPHASPVFHAIQFLLGNIEEHHLRAFRSFGGLQAYPSRTKDPDPVDFSTGSVGLGAVIPNFAALTAQYVDTHFPNSPSGHNAHRRFYALMGDAELDEGNIWEALADDNLQNVPQVTWIVDLNRQSLDRVVPNGKVQKLKELFRAQGWHVIELKYGARLQSWFARPGGERLRTRIDDMPNDEYQALLRVSDPEAMRRKLVRPGGKLDSALESLLEPCPPEELHAVLADLGGHDIEAILNGFAEAERVPTPAVIIAYTIKGWGLPIAGDPLNHSKLLTPDQIETFRQRAGIPAGREFSRFAEGTPESALAMRRAAELRATGEDRNPAGALAHAAIPASLDISWQSEISTQQAFGNIVTALSRHAEIASRLVTTAPDVAISTNLGGWIQKMGVWCHQERTDYFRENAVSLALNWTQSPRGHHIELGISENNLFLMLAALGLSHELFGVTLLPIGTLYDCFLSRGLDAFQYGLYNDSKFIVAGTPSGISLSPEGGAHQSIVTPSIAMEMPNLEFWEPTFARELEWIVLESLRQVADRKNGRSAYLRLSTVPVSQELLPAAPPDSMREGVLRGGYRLIDRRGDPGYSPQDAALLFTSGVMTPEAIAASAELAAEGLFVNVIQVTSASRLFRGWSRGERPFALEGLIPPEERGCPIVTLLDGHPHALAFLGGVFGQPVTPLGVDRFGQSGERHQLYDAYGIGRVAIVNALLRAWEASQDGSGVR